MKKRTKQTSSVLIQNQLWSVNLKHWRT